jgi:hypothetical protein
MQIIIAGLGLYLFRRKKRKKEKPHKILKKKHTISRLASRRQTFLPLHSLKCYNYRVRYCEFSVGRVQQCHLLGLFEDKINSAKMGREQLGVVFHSQSTAF